MHYFPLIYFNNKPSYALRRLAANHQEYQMYINSSQSTQRMTIPTAVYTQLFLLMMSRASPKRVEAYY